MAGQFDPYHQWLCIPPEEQPRTFADSALLAASGAKGTVERRRHVTTASRGVTAPTVELPWPVQAMDRGVIVRTHAPLNSSCVTKLKGVH